jgi:uncharacterized damage-inducible protein DinB
MTTAARTEPVGRLIVDIRRAHDGGAWHGPSLAELLRDISADEAVRHPIAGAHSVAELVAHLTSWAREVERRLRRGVADEPERGDWPDVLDGAEGWEAMRGALFDAHASLLSRLQAFDPARLDDTIPDGRDDSSPTSVTYYDMVSGMVQHDAYHGGQIALLRRALRRRTD